MNDHESATPARACPVCGAPVPAQPGAGQPTRYCSSRCKSRAARQRRIERENTPKQPAEHTTASVSGEDLRVARQLSRETAIGMVVADPDALNTVLTRAKPMIAAPAHRATGWREVAATISALAAMIPED